MLRFYFVLIVTLFSATNVAAKSIVVLGDSISAGYGIELNKGWVSLLQEKLRVENKQYTVFNESISGDTSAGGLARIDKLLVKYQPKILILELGANDGLRGLSLKHMKSNLAEIITRSQKSGAKVLLVSMRIPPNYGKRYVDKFYDIYPQLAEQMQVTFIPFILQDVALAKELMQKDKLHPNANAQPIITDKIWQYLGDLI